jgi:hypothetical protein
MTDPKLQALIDLLTIYLGRLPTEKEVLDFINGDESTRRDIIIQALNRK